MNKTTENEKMNKTTENEKMCRSGLHNEDHNNLDLPQTGFSLLFRVYQHIKHVVYPV